MWDTDVTESLKDLMIMVDNWLNASAGRIFWSQTNAIFGDQKKIDWKKDKILKKGRFK